MQEPEQTPGLETQEPQAPGLPFRVRDVVFAVVMGLVIGILATAVIIAILFGSSGDEVSQVIVYSLSSILIYAAMFWTVHLFVIGRRNLSWSVVGLKQPKEGFILKTIGILFLTMFSAAIVNLLIAEFFTDPPDVQEQLSVSGSIDLSSAEVLLLAISLVVAAPVVEEIVFRGMIFPLFRARWKLWPAAVATSLLFAAVHFTLTLIPALFLLGLALAWLTERYESIYPAIVLHGLNNGLVVVILLLVAD